MTPARGLATSGSPGRRWRCAAALGVVLGACSMAAQEPIKVEVELVRLSCSATHHGVPVPGLRQDDFIVREDGVAQPVRYFWQEADLPLTVGLIVDVSVSQAGLVGKHKETLTRFFRQVLRPQDRALIVTVGPQARLLTDFTASQEALAEGIERLHTGGGAGTVLGEPCRSPHAQSDDATVAQGRGPRAQRARRRIFVPCGGTALWNAIYWASRLKMKETSGRKALIVLSDGWDTGSQHGLEDAIEAAQAAETPVYTIKFVGPLAAALFPPIALKHSMQKLSDATGGVGYGMLHGDLGEVFRRIEQELRNQYVLAYTPANRARDGKFRQVEVSTTRPSVKVRTRTGYRASEGF